MNTEWKKHWLNFEFFRRLADADDKKKQSLEPNIMIREILQKNVNKFWKSHHYYRFFHFWPYENLQSTYEIKV